MREGGREGLSERETTANNHRSIAGRVVKEQNGDWDKRQDEESDRERDDEGSLGEKDQMSQI